MPITKSAKKTHRASLKKRVYNARRKNVMGDAVKTFNKLLVEGKKEEAQTMIPIIQRGIDKAAKRGVIKKNTAARKKSRLVAALQRTGK